QDHVGGSRPDADAGLRLWLAREVMLHPAREQWVAAVVVDDRKPFEPSDVGVLRQEPASRGEDQRLLEEPRGVHVAGGGALQGQGEVHASREQLLQYLALRAVYQAGAGARMRPQETAEPGRQGAAGEARARPH